MPKEYSNPQITEAVIDFRCDVASGVTINTLKQLHKKMEGEYPEIREIHNFQHKIILNKEEKSSELKNLGVVGYRLESEDKKYILQFQLNGFSLSRLKPYLGWESFVNTAKKAWDVYSSIGIGNIKRVAIRYINIFNVPLPIEQIEDYINGFPKIFPNDKMILDKFSNRFQLRESTRNFGAIITQALLPQKNPNEISILLDLDVFKEECYRENFNAAWDTLGDLKQFAKDTFDELATKKIKDLIK